MAQARITQRLVDHVQLSYSNLNKTNYTPGSTSGRALDQNWPKQFDLVSPIPVVQSLIASGKLVQSVIVDNKKRSVDERKIPNPVTLDTNTITTTNLETEEESVYTQVITRTQNNDGSQERNTGFFGFKA